MCAVELLFPLCEEMVEGSSKLGSCVVGWCLYDGEGMKYCESFVCQ